VWSKNVGVPGAANRNQFLAFRLNELLKDRTADIGGHAGASVDDRDLAPFGSIVVHDLFDRDDDAASLGKPDGVADEVQQHLTHTVSVANDFGAQKLWVVNLDVNQAIGQLRR